MDSSSCVHESLITVKDLTLVQIRLPSGDDACAHVMEYIEGKPLEVYEGETRLSKYFEDSPTGYVCEPAFL